MFIDYMQTPLGTMEIKASNSGIVHVIFCGNIISDSQPNALTANCIQQLSEYFAGNRTRFDLPLSPKGTSFQQQVWRCLSKIPYGQTWCYGDIANMLNKPKAAQAVGGANGRNPLTIIVPCHRIIGKSGALTGYAGGLERKLWLLNHEGLGIDLSKEQQQSELIKAINKRQSKTEYLD